MHKTIKMKAPGSCLAFAALSAYALTSSFPVFHEGYGWVSVPAVMVVACLIAVLEKR